MLDGIFSSEYYRNNRQRLRELFQGTAPIVITANVALQRSGDSTFPFRQDSNFWYLTGIDSPEIILVLDKDKEYLIIPDREQSYEQFEGRINHQQTSNLSGISTILGETAGFKTLNSRIKKVKHVATLAAAPAYIPGLGLYTNPARSQLIAKLKTVNPDLELLDLREHLTRLRSLKQKAELNALQKAIDITNAAIKESTKAKRLQKFDYEYELEAAISYGFRSRGASGHAFSPIIASGQRACILHNSVNNSALLAGDLVTVDVGAEVNHYAADITRTISIGGKPTTRQRNIYDSVLEVQNYALSLIKPGVVLREYEKEVMHYMGEKLRELSLIKSIDKETVRRYFPHSTSHFLGLDAHDVGNYDLPLEENMVITCEPGIYINAEGIGVRIEDDVLVTKSGVEVMSRRLPRSLY